MRKTAIIAISLTLISAITFQTIITITVDDRLSFSSYIQEYNDSVKRIVVSVENTGSVTCPARARAFDGKQRFWSEEAEVRPGGVQELEIYYLSPYNETRNLGITVYFCDETERAGEVLARPSNLTEGDTGIEIKAYPDRIVAKGSGVVIPFDNPSNYAIPSFAVNGSREVGVSYPRPLQGNVTFLLASGDSYEIVTVEVERPVPVAILLPAAALAALVLYVLAKKRKHGPGKGEDGGRHTEKSKGRGKAKAHKGRKAR